MGLLRPSPAPLPRVSDGASCRPGERGLPSPLEPLQRPEKGVTCPSPNLTLCARYRKLAQRVWIAIFRGVSLKNGELKLHEGESCKE